MNIMDLGEESSRYGSALPSTTSRNMSSSSSAAFFSANQSPFFSPRSPAMTATCHLSESTRSEATSLPFSPEPAAAPPVNLQQSDRISSSAAAGNHRRDRRYGGESGPVSLSSNRIRSCDVFIGLHGRKPSLLRFVNWLRSELEAQGMSCFVSDRARLRNTQKHGMVEKAMDVTSFGVVVLTAKSFGNPYTIEELRLFSGKKTLVPIFFELSSGECLVRDIVEKRGDPWEEDGGELWAPYGGDENEWREAVRGLSRVAAAEEWKLEARDGNWRDCVSRAVALLATKLGRRSVVDRLAKWRENADMDEFPFPRNEGFVGRKRELSELEFMLFGELVSGESERGYFELKARPRRKKDPGLSEDYHNHQHRRRKGKDVWKESEKEIEMNTRSSPTRRRRRRSSSSSSAAARIQYGKGIACVSGEPGIGKTELLLEFAYRHHQRYKMVLWIGGESRYIRQNYLNLRSFLDVEVGVEGVSSFEEHEDGAVSRVRRELMRNIPFLVVIDNLESDEDWWDRRPVMDLLPRFGGDTHIIVSTRLHRPLNLEPLRLSFLSAAESMSLMTQGTEYMIAETDALRVIEDRLGRSTIGLAIVGSILSELPITPSRLLETANRMMIPAPKAKASFLSQLFEVCFSIFDHADGPESLATRMVHSSGWFAPSPIPIHLLAQAARRIPQKTPRTGRRLWLALLRSLACGLAPTPELSEAEASSTMLVRFGLARGGTRPGLVRVSDSVRLYARARAVPGVPRAVVQAVMARGWDRDHRHADHVWAACFLLFGFGRDPVAVEAEVADLLAMVRETVVPLAVKTFVSFSRCGAAVELLRLCTNAMEAAEQAFVTPVEKWLDGPVRCWRPVRTGAQLNPCLWQELALGRAAVLETRAKLMIRGGQFDVADDLIRKTVFIRTSICGEDHSDTAAARETLGKITRLLANVHIHTSI